VSNIDRASIFRAFNNRNYSLFYFGQLVARIGIWMQRTAVIWVLYSTTQSTMMVGLATFAEQFPSFIFSPLGGIVADRFDRYQVLVVTQIVAATQAVSLTAFYFGHYQQVWLILSLSVLLGIANAFDVPARQAMVNDLVEDTSDLSNAIAMNASSNNLARLIGPALSGIVLANFGAGICFAATAIGFMFVLASVFMIKVRKNITPRKPDTLVKDLKDGFLYAKNNREIAYTLMLLASVCALIVSYNTLIPTYAQDIFKGDASVFGYINACVGVGAITGTFYMASLKSGANLKKILFGSLLILGVTLMLFAYTTHLLFGLVLSAVCGFGTMLIVPVCNTIVQTVSVPEMRGRVISLFAMAAFGTLPLGSLLVGWVSKFIGPENTIFIQGIFAILLAALFSRFLLKKSKNR